MASVLNEEIEDSSDGTYDLITFIEYSGKLVANTGYVDAYGFESLPPSTISSLKVNVRGCEMNTEEYGCLVEYYQEYFDGDVPYIFGRNEECMIGEGCRRAIVSDRIHKFKSIDLLGQHYISSQAASTRGSYIRAYFKDPDVDKEHHKMRPAQVKYFFRHEMELLNEGSSEPEKFTFTFAYVEWFEQMENSNQITTFNSINSTCYKNSVLAPSYLNILPVHSIYSPVGAYIDILDNHNIFIDFPRKIAE
ncbi:hypothetical protein G6F56_009974 [Rhizopus delemar]|nr:hypothetical protein G6F56_009974 [Rhizopus delemar]